MSRQPREGRIFERGVIKAADIAAGLGLGGSEPEVKPTEALTPEQARRKSEGKPIGPGAPDFEEVTIKGGRDAYEHFGMPDLSTSEAHKVSGQPGPEPPERAPKAEPQRTDWDAVDRPKLDDAKRPPADDAKQRAALAAAAREGKRMVEEARANGTADAETVNAGVRLAAKIADGLKRLGQ